MEFLSTAIGIPAINLVCNTI